MRDKMPIKAEDAKKYKGYQEDEVKIAQFLEKNKGNAFTDEEVMKGIGKTPKVYTPDEKGSYWTWQNVGNFTVEVLGAVSFRNTLNDMVRKGKIKVSEVAGITYYYID
jgi:hypothetical protein